MLEKITNIIENSQSFGILIDQNSEDCEFLLKEVLKKTILKNETPVLDLPKACLPEGKVQNELQEKWSTISKPSPIIEFPKKTLIKLPKDKYGIKEVSYKTQDGNLALVLTANTENILIEDISLEKLPPETEVVFCFFDEENKINQFKNSIQIPNNEKIIFITSKTRTQTEKVFDIIKIFNPKILNDSEISTLLFAALVTETNNFSERKTKEVLSLGGLLLEKGVDKEKISEIIKKENSLFFNQIFGRAMARTYTDQELAISWSFLNNKDFQKTNNISITPQKIYKIIKKISYSINPQKLNILIWQTINGVECMIADPKNLHRPKLLTLAEKIGTNLNSRYFTTGPFKNFSEAEIYLKNTIREIEGE